MDLGEPVRKDYVRKGDRSTGAATANRVFDTPCSVSEIRSMWLIGTLFDQALAFLAFSVVLLLLARVAYGSAE